MKQYTLGIYEKAMPAGLSWKEKCLAAQAAGYDFIEISIDETDEKLSRLDMTAAERLALLQVLSETGIKIHTMCLSGHRKYPFGSSDKEIAGKSLAIMQKALTFSVDMGIRIIQLAGYDVYYEQGTAETKKRFEENLHIAVAMAQKEGVLLGFETMETDFMDTVGKAMAYVKKINSPYLHVYPDSGNLVNAALKYGHDVLADIKTGRGHLIALHLKESKPGVYREVPYGAGHVNFDAVIDTAVQEGVRKFVTEFWYTKDTKDWRQALKEACGMMGPLIEKRL